MKVSVIILNWNGIEHGLIRRYLPSVIANTNSEIGQVIVADNGSTDDSLKVLAEEFPEVRVIALPENYGFAEGYNQAIAQIDTPYVLLLNDDVAVPEGWLEPLVAYLDNHTEAGAVQPKLLSDRDHSQFEYAGAAGGYLDCLGYPYCRGRIFQDVETDHGQYDLPTEIDWATGAAILIRTDLYRKAGGLDSHFFAHMEEIDLCWRLRRMGYKLACVPESSAFHLGGASLNAGNPRKTMLNFRNSLLMLHKNLPANKRKGIILRRKLLDGVAALNFLAHGQFAHIRAIWQAHREASRMIKDYYGTGSTGSEYSKEAPLRNHSIIWQYYIGRHHKFSDLPCHRS
ncbi:MAG: glycosyltransferase family 2 protein [Bacteroidales bacterium]|nr:glycosyltransferase family 2 protein [Candidatus Liminaster caballi]